MVDGRVSSKSIPAYDPPLDEWLILTFEMFSRLFVDTSPLNSTDFVLLCGAASDASHEIQVLILFVLLQTVFATSFVSLRC
jgi:hypothetical protein